MVLRPLLAEASDAVYYKYSRKFPAMRHGICIRMLACDILYIFTAFNYYSRPWTANRFANLGGFDLTRSPPTAADDLLEVSEKKEQEKE